jgi:hypothetical protein
MLLQRKKHRFFAGYVNNIMVEVLRLTKSINLRPHPAEVPAPLCAEFEHPLKEEAVEVSELNTHFFFNIVQRPNSRSCFKFNWQYCPFKWVLPCFLFPLPYLQFLKLLHMMYIDVFNFNDLFYKCCVIILGFCAKLHTSSNRLELNVLFIMSIHTIHLILHEH